MQKQLTALIAAERRVQVPLDATYRLSHRKRVLVAALAVQGILNNCAEKKRDRPSPEASPVFKCRLRNDYSRMNVARGARI